MINLDSGLVSIIGLSFGDVLYIQDIGYKYKGKVYIDKNDNKLYECLSDGNITSNTVGDFRLISLVGNEIYSKNEEKMLIYNNKDVSSIYEDINKVLLKSKRVSVFLLGGCTGSLNAQLIYAKYSGSEVYFVNWNSNDNWTLTNIESNGLDDAYSQAIAGIGRSILIKVNEISIAREEQSWNIVSKNIE